MQNFFMCRLQVKGVILNVLRPLLLPIFGSYSFTGIFPWLED